MVIENETVEFELHDQGGGIGKYIIIVYLSGHGINWGGRDGDFYYLIREAYTASV